MGADAVNGVRAARDGWAAVAVECRAPLRFVEVICSDQEEHRRRVEGRGPDLPGQGVPTWEQVRNRRWEPFTTPRLLVDNTGDPAEHVAVVLDWLATTS